jgi:hypothetical protein
MQSPSAAWLRDLSISKMEKNQESIRFTHPIIIQVSSPSLHSVVASVDSKSVPWKREVAWPLLSNRRRLPCLLRFVAADSDVVGVVVQ